MTEERLKEVEKIAAEFERSGYRWGSELVAEVRRLRGVLERVKGQDRTRGYATGAEWGRLVDEVSAALGPWDASAALARGDRIAITGPAGSGGSGTEPHNWEIYEIEGGLGFGRTCRQCGQKERAVFGQGLVERDGDGSCGSKA